MTNKLHTPTPWVYSKATVPDNTGGYDYAITVDGKIIAEVFQHTGWDDEKTGKYETQPVEANAAFIVRACNSHVALVEALEIAIRHHKKPLIAAELDAYPYILTEALALAKGE